MTREFCVLDVDEASYRDGVLRSFFHAVLWERGPEFALTRELVVRGDPVLTPWPYLVEYEWEVVPGHSNRGKGDLLYTDGLGSYAAVEVKFIDPRRGATARKKRNSDRSKVVDQARRRAEQVVHRYGATRCVGISVTNEGPPTVQGVVPQDNSPG